MLIRLLLVLLPISLPLGSYAEETRNEAYRWLEKMHNAVQQLNYEGTFVYLHNHHMESMRIIHTVEDGVERERLVSLNGAQREVVRSKGEVICIQPDIKTVLVGKRQSKPGIANIIPFEPGKISAYYDFRVQGEERIADKNAKVILVIPKDENRYGHRVSLDMETALPLRTDLLDNSGKPVSQIMFTSMKVGPMVQDNTLELVTQEELKNYEWNYQKPMQKHQAGNKSGHSRWVFQSLPDGFRMSLHETRDTGTGGSGVEHFVFTDGLATMSVYIEKAMSKKLFEGGSQMGAIHAFGTNVDGFQITAVGEVPAQTVKRFAQSVTVQKTQQE
jgi:sigma-E factor negative regulatory protein RseB